MKTWQKWALGLAIAVALVAVFRHQVGMCLLVAGAVLEGGFAITGG